MPAGFYSIRKKNSTKFEKNLAKMESRNNNIYLINSMYSL